ncbi:polyhomeotic-like protein 2b [Chanos chanos]|uniref:Polyhomeotic-like protein 2b n=1 Tax=Chanos chanos TaxID=29144 RepID=A0A6J2VHV6_CHACN|nr:polyhomeotic-like protein 2 [Chanos chanos]
MESETAPPASSNSTSPPTSTTNTSTSMANTACTPSSSSSASTPSSSSSGTARQPVSQISVYSGISDRQTVQVIQQALHRQPSTAAQYLQQMYAAQQQHLMLQTAALQQQHLSTTQLQSLAAVQQASIAAGRQNSTQNGTSATQNGSTQTTINLTSSPAAAQLISRAQNVNSAPASISQQAVLLGNPASPALTASQAQMYLRAQMAQQSNLVHVARSLGRAVPLSPQLILAPTATVTALQSDTSTQSSSQQSAPAQVQNLAVRSQQQAASSYSSSSSSCPSTGLQGLSLKQTPVSIQPTALIKTPSLNAAGSKTALPPTSSEGAKKSESSVGSEVKPVNMSRTVTSSHPLIAPAYAQIQPHALVKQQPQQFVIQQQAPPTPRAQSQLLQTASVQPHPQASSLTIQSAIANQTSGQTGSIPVLPKSALHQGTSPAQQATIFHSTVSPHALAHHGPHSSPVTQAKGQPVQLTAINLQIQPAHSQVSKLTQDCKDKPTSLVVRESCLPLAVQAAASTPPQDPSPPEKPKTDSVTFPKPTPGACTAESACVSEAAPPQTMTSGNESEPAAVTGSTAHNGENKPPQAIVKPHVLTHVIEGFVIQEGAEPFPVERAVGQGDSPKKPDQQLPSDPEKTPVSNPPTNTTDSETEEPNQQDTAVQSHKEADAPKLKCEFCGWLDFAYKFKGSKRFCSMVCAKRYNVGCTKRIGLFHPDRTKTANRWRRRSRSRGRRMEAKKQKLSTAQQSQGESVSSPLPSQPSIGESSPCSDMSSYEEPPSPLSAASSGPPRHLMERSPAQEELPLLTQHFLPCDPTKWNVEEVFEFIRSLPGCQEIADEFRSQEIDGQAMLLLKEDHLMSAMNIKLGPALKIYARINMLKDS